MRVCSVSSLWLLLLSESLKSLNYESSSKKRGRLLQATENTMALKKSLILFPMLALILRVLLGWVRPSLAQEPGAMRFIREHIDPQVPFTSNTTYCDVMMVLRNMTRGACKEVNNFVHTSLPEVNAVCHNDFTKCANGSRVCHQSSSPMILTHCVLKRSSKYPNCTYWSNPIAKYIVVICDGNPYVPVHFDRCIST
ncbi:ribonuclease pancreatic-like [Suncus etruscus]|uniref:ribonuclease pancreatic-like n=1 Tax=Suncus etruscus TaxID=109475 RepID=UPI00211079C8|nr:ribonuclease pancreatic-like [Suncus etruscus]